MIYQYPFDDFVSDFETLRPSIDFEDYDFAEEAMITSQYIRATYSDQTDRVERGCALGMAVSFVGKHRDELGLDADEIPRHLLRAIHALVCFAAIEIRPSPKPSEVLGLAEIYANERST